MPAQPKRVVVAIQSTPPTISSQQVGAGSGTLQGGDGLEDLLNAGMGVLDKAARSARTPRPGGYLGVECTRDRYGLENDCGTLAARWDSGPYPGHFS